MTQLTHESAAQEEPKSFKCVSVFNEDSPPVERDSFFGLKGQKHCYIKGKMTAEAYELFIMTCGSL